MPEVYLLPYLGSQSGPADTSAQTGHEGNSPLSLYVPLQCHEGTVPLYMEVLFLIIIANRYIWYCRSLLSRRGNLIQHSVSCFSGRPDASRKWQKPGKKVVVASNNSTTSFCIGRDSTDCTRLNGCKGSAELCSVRCTGDASSVAGPIHVSIL